MANNATLIEKVEDNLDTVLVAILAIGLGTVTGNFGDFSVFLTDAVNASFSMSGEFYSFGDATSPTVISWGGALAILAGAAIFLTNLGIENFVNRPSGMEMEEYALALGVVGIPIVIELDVLNIHTDYIAGSPGVGLVVLGLVVAGAAVLSVADRS